MEIRDKELLW